MHLTREQRTIVRRLIKNRDCDQVQSLGGYAGTGKTTVVGALAQALPEYAACAFTGKAAHVMRQKGMAATTIHSLIYSPVRTRDGGIRFVRKARFELGFEGFLVDEASMINRTLYDDLLSFGLPVIFVGDHGQLPPVGSDVFVMADPTYQLETIHRNAGEIAYFAEHLRHGKPPKSFITGSQVELVEPDDVTNGHVLGAGQIICAYNMTRIRINQRVRRLRGRNELLEKRDRIICLRNNRDAGIFNGQIGVVVRVDLGKTPRMDFRSGGVLYEDIGFDPNTFGLERPEIKYDPHAPHPFDYAYCITAHKAQGSEWKNVMVFEQECQHWEHRRWAYTAASRARRSLVWILGPVY